MQLYNLADDVAESHDVAAQNPEVVGRIDEIMRTGRTRSGLFPLRGS